MDGMSELQEAYLDWLVRQAITRKQIDALRQSMQDELVALFEAHCPVKVGDVVRIEQWWVEVAGIAGVEHDPYSNMPRWDLRCDVAREEDGSGGRRIRNGSLRCMLSPVRNPKTREFEYDVVRRPRQDEREKEVG